MSLGISWGDESLQTGGFILFDAVTVYVRNSKGSVTKQPISSGGFVTDHFIKDNDTMTISGVISGSDISSNSYLIKNLEGASAINSFQPLSPVSVNSTDQSILQKFIPDSIGQFLSDSTSDITMDVSREDLLEPIRDSLQNLNSGVIFNEKTSQFDPDIKLVKIYEYDGILLRKVINNLVVTNLVFKEDPSSGYALYFDMTLEQVTFAFLKKAAIPKDVLDSLKKKSEKKSTKGKVDSTPDSGEPPKDLDPLREARNN